MKHITTFISLLVFGWLVALPADGASVEQVVGQYVSFNPSAYVLGKTEKVKVGVRNNSSEPQTFLLICKAPEGWLIESLTSKSSADGCKVVLKPKETLVEEFKINAPRGAKPCKLTWELQQSAWPLTKQLQNIDQLVVQSPTKDEFQRHLQQVAQKAVSDNYNALFDFIKVVHALFAHYKTGTVRITSVTTLDGTNDAGVDYCNIAEVRGVLHLNWENTLVGNWADPGWTEVIFVRDWQAKSFRYEIKSNASPLTNGVPNLAEVTPATVIKILLTTFGFSF